MARVAESVMKSDILLSCGVEPGTVDTKVKGAEICVQASHRGYERQLKTPCSSANVKRLATRHLRDLVQPPLFPRSRNGNSDLPSVTC